MSVGACQAPGSSRPTELAGTSPLPAKLRRDVTGRLSRSSLMIIGPIDRPTDRVEQARARHERPSRIAHDRPRVQTNPLHTKPEGRRTAMEQRLDFAGLAPE